MADPSSSNTCSACNFDVFLSFRGEDTRKTFTDHLYTEFVNAGFITFRDDNELERGEEIRPALQKAIQQSRCSVVVLSKDYASSGWCLDELVMILERKRLSSDHVVVPVFYDVEPSDLRNQTGSVASAFARHEKKIESLKFEVGRWRAALCEVADLAGLMLRNEADGHESEFVKKIVKVIEDKIGRTPLSVAPYLIGIHSRVEDINSWLHDKSTDVRILVLCGMRGIGKTTIAKFVYNSNFKRFEGCSFLENIREVSRQPNGLVQLQKQLLYDVLNGRNVEVHSTSEGIMKVEKAISSRKVLLVLDDVDHKDQLEAIVSMQDRICGGSKIIITTSRIGLFKDHQKFEMHNIEGLSYSESLELFSWHAFGQNHPIEGYMELSARVVHHSAGLPLALKVLGSSLSGTNIDVWKDALRKLEAIPDDEIVRKLRISFDSLQDDHDRNLFLHIASFFTGMDIYVIVQILEGCNFYPTIGIQNLVDRCLVTIDGNNKVQMHQMIRDMGRGIVRLESEEPQRRSRLWNHDDSLEVLTKKNGTERIEGLILNMRRYSAYTPQISNEVVLETNAFASMHKLRLLQLTHVNFRGCYKGFLTDLRWMCWNEFPFRCLPNDFPLERLVVLELCYSSLRKVWRGAKSLPSLKILNLSHSLGLTETPDFSRVSSLKRLVLKGCTNLIAIHESIANLKRLVYLDVEGCKNIRRLPMLQFLEILIISGCSNLDEFPMEMVKIYGLKVLEADGVPISHLLPRKNPDISWSSCIRCNLVELSLTGCNLTDDDFPWDFGNLSSLRRLNLSCNPLSGLPDWVRGVARLDELSLSQCTRLKSLEGLPTVGELIVHGCSSLEVVTFQPMPFLPSIILDESNWKLVELEYYFKLKPLERVYAENPEIIEVLRLGKCLTSMQTIMVMMDSIHVFNIGRTKMQPIQGLYEHGIFSTFLPGNEVPGSFKRTSTMPKIYFTVPVHPYRKIRGLNIFSVYEKSSNGSLLMNAKLHFDHRRTAYNPIVTEVCNKTKRLEWIYGPSFFGVPRDGEQMIWLSHWKFGNQLEGGDDVKVSVLTTSELKVNKFGIEIVYDDQEEKLNTDQHTTDVDARSYVGFDISENMSPSDMAKMGQIMRTYLLCSRPEALRESAECFGNEVVSYKFGGQELKRDSGMFSEFIPDVPRMPQEGRGCTMQVKAFFHSLYELVDCCVPGRRREAYGGWRNSSDIGFNLGYRYYRLRNHASHTFRREYETTTISNYTSAEYISYMAVDAPLAAVESNYTSAEEYISGSSCMIVDNDSPTAVEKDYTSAE